METRIRYKGEPPFTREEAVSEGAGTYVRAPETGKHCPVCHCDVVYTETNECVACVGQALWVAAKADPAAFPLGTQSALSLGLEYTINGQYCHGGPHLKSPSISPNGPKCVICSEKKVENRLAARAASPRRLAILAKKKWYMPDKSCHYCGKTELKSVENGRCQGCRPLTTPQSTPRLIAKAAGQMKYLPTVPCKDCGGIYMKRVNNGECDGCVAIVKEARGLGPRTPTLDGGTRAVMAAMGPDYLVDRNQAKAMGLTAYRDGKYCPDGHTGWKFLANDTCVTCKGEDHEPT